jgi:aminopeptidase YwaD
MRKMKFVLILSLLVFSITISWSQDKDQARKSIDTLASPYFWGRGYTNDGLKKAAEYLAAEFKSYGLEPLSGKSFFQEFSYPVNTFPGKMEVTINDVVLTPGKDFIVSPDSRGIKAKGTLTLQDTSHFINADSRIVVSVENKLTWSVAPQPQDYTTLQIIKSSLKDKPSSFRVDIENKVVKDFKTANICGVVKGTQKPDSLIVLTAHFDHLGGMGRNTYFPGANDNASGIALLLNLAKYYAANPQPYSIVFIFFSGEEAGLIGSKYFTDHPLVSLSKIRFLLNIDLAGTGDDGITVVNASVFSKEFSLLKEINTQNNYFVQVKSRGKAANSDHYWFTEKGVPSFFIYALGGIKAYHDVFDKAETLPMTEYNDLFKIIVSFNAKLMKL